MLIMDNQDKVLVVDLANVAASPHFRPALVDIKTYADAEIDELDNAIFYGVSGGWGSSYQTTITLTGTKYFTSFGSRTDPIQIQGFMVVSTADASGAAQGDGSTRYTPSPYTKLKNFVETYSAVDSDLTTDDMLKVYIDNVEHTCALVQGRYQTSQAESRLRLFTFDLLFEEMI